VILNKFKSFEFIVVEAFQPFDVNSFFTDVKLFKKSKYSEDNSIQIEIDNI